MPEIKITINKQDGTVQVEGEGYRGPSCVQDIDELSKILGLMTESSRAKTEYSQVVGTQRVKK